MTDALYLEKLNPAQRAAVEYLGGPELVIAGAGSGKTRVLTYKIVHLLNNGHNPARLLALTFTNKAANEMRERISALVGEDVASKLWMGTFHSIFSRILRLYADRIGFKSNFTIYDASDSKSLVKTIIKDLALDDAVYRPGLVASEISNAKNNLFGADAYIKDPDILRENKAAKRERIGEIYKLYVERCRIAGAMDFDDLLYYTNLLLRDNDDIRTHFQNYFSYILVDEYQDTNFAQHMIVRQLCGPRQDLCVVGDDAQSIYSFRGANIRNILDLKKSFPALEIFKLEQNYRSTKNIIGAANSLIAANTAQIHKDVFSTNSSGDCIEVVQCYNDYEEGYTVAARISQVRRRLGIAAKDVAILYRTNAQSRVIEEALRNRNMPYRVYGGLAFYQRKEVKDAICYFRLAVNPNDEEALKRVINTPKRGIGETTVKKLTACALAAGISIFSVLQDPLRYELAVNKGTLTKLQSFTDIISSIHSKCVKGATASEVAKAIFRKADLLAEFADDKTPENITRRDNLLSLIRGVDEFTETKLATEGPEEAGMQNYIAYTSLLTDQDEASTEDSITLMTIHAAKGLEFDAVFLVGAEENLLPSEMSIKSKNAASEIEEERRLMYVAITRAKQFCQVSYARQRVLNGKPVQSFPSRFLHDIDSRYMRLVGGSKLDGPHRKPTTPKYTYNDILTPSKAQPQKAVEKPRPVSIGATTSNASASSGEFVTHTSAELSEGQRIQHSVFGLGVIKYIDTDSPDHRVKVEFTSGENRTLMLKFARFKLLT